MAKIISIINFKGGVGKTTIALNIGAGLAKNHSQRILLIDTDPQTNLTFSLLPFNRWKKQVEENGSIKNLFEAFMERNLSYTVKSSIIKKPVIVNDDERISHLDLLPSHLSMLLIDVHLAKSFVIMGEFEDKYLEMWEHRSIMRNGLQEIMDDYDLIIIDCPPNFNIVTQNAIFSSDCYIIPAIPDYLSVLGMKVIDGLVKEIDYIGKNISPKLKRKYKETDILGIVFNRVKLGSKGPVHLHSSKMAQIEEMYPNKVFKNYITDSIAIPESTGECVPIYEYDNPKAKNSKDQFTDLTQEIFNRIKSLG